MNKTIAAPCGGALPAAIGIIRISGADCARVLDEIFIPKCRKSTTERIVSKLYYGKLLDSEGGGIDLCMAAFFKAPHSYTGEDMAELYCHGSAAVIAAALQSIYSRGARAAEPGEFTRRAFLCGRLDLTEAEATADLIHSTSALAARNAVSQLEGSVGGEIKRLRTDISGILAHYYAVCDYTDEDIVPFEYEKAAEALNSAADRLQALADGFERGSAVKNGIPVAVVGRPNSGKSSLFNALAGFDRAIVTTEEGTTRDVIEEHITCGGALFRLFDTAGIRAAQGEAEAQGIKRSLSAAQAAHGVICVFDGSRPLSDEDRQAAALAPDGIPRCAVINKNDLGICESAEKSVRALGFDTVFILSAKKKSGLAPLSEWLCALAPQGGGVLVTNPRQAHLMQSAAQALRLSARAAADGMTADAFLSDAERALSELGRITGETASADIAAEIFSRFCVGK